MLIAACGAGGTGKTTTMQALAAATKIPFIPSASRAVFARRGIKESDQDGMTPHQQWELQQEIFKAREDLEAVTAEGLADRTLFDQVAYNLLRAGKVITEEMYSDLVRRAYNAACRYDFIFYFPLTKFHGDEDGMRDTSFGLRYNFDAILGSILGYTGIAYSILPIASVAERVNIIRAKANI